MEKLTFIFKSGKEVSIFCKKWRIKEEKGNNMLVNIEAEEIHGKWFRYLRFDDISAILSETIDEI